MDAESALVVSDTHGNTSLMERVTRWASAVHGVRRLFHLGDSYRDGRAMLGAGGLEGFVVPGIYCEEYTRSDVPNVITVELAGKKVRLVHALEDAEKSGEGRIDIVLFGHTHVPGVEKRGETWYVNPGHLKPGFSKGRAPSYGLLRRAEGKLVFEWYHPGTDAPVPCRLETLFIL